MLGILEHLDEAIALTDVELHGHGPHIRYANPAFVELTGRSLRAVIGSGLAGLRAGDTDSGELHRLVMAAINDGEPVRRVVHLARADRAALWVELDVAPLADESGTVAQVLLVLRDVTEQVSRQELLAVAGWRAFDLCVVVDADGRVLRAEPAEQPLMGHVPGDVLGAVLLHWVHPADEAMLAQALVAPHAAGVVMARLRHGDGSWRWLELRIVDRRGDARIDGIVVVGRDVSDRAQAQAELSQTTGQLQMAVSVAGLGTWRLDLTEGTVAQDAHAANQVDIDPDGPPLTLEQGLAYVHPDDREPLRDAIRLAIAEDRSFERTFRVDQGDGTWRWLLARGEVAFAADGTPSYVNGVTLDVTGRHDVAEQVTRTLEGLADAYFALDHEWRFTFLNARAEHLLDRSRDELIGRPVWEGIPAPVATLCDRSYRRAVHTGEPVTFEMFYPPNECWYEVRVLPGDDGLAVLLHDVTDRVRIEAEQHRLLAAERTARRAAEAARQAAEASQAELAHAVAHDALTGLVNRTELEHRLGALLNAPSTSVAVLLFDLDDFKLINNSLGHTVGDTLLCHVAGRLTRDDAQPTLACRLGGDKFVVACEDLDVDSALAFAHRLKVAIQEPYHVEGRTVSVSTSAGVTIATAHDDADTIIRNAATATSSAKRKGHGHVAVYDTSLHQHELCRLDTSTDLRATRHGEQLELHYQAIFDVATGTRVAAEALLRWHHPTRGLLLPGAFIDLAEETGLIVPVGAWVIDRACQAVAAQRSTHAPRTLWVNASAPQLMRSDFASTIEAAQQRHGVRRGELGVELTERTLITDPEAVGTQLAALHHLGVRIAVDDFGTGYSSMSSLQQYPIDVLKVDRSFTNGLASPDGDAIVRAIVELAHALGASASAEGVETPQQLEAVRATGCDTAAGFLLHRPQPSDTPMPDAHGH